LLKFSVHQHPLSLSMYQ